MKEWRLEGEGACVLYKLIMAQRDCILTHNTNDSYGYNSGLIIMKSTEVLNPQRDYIAVAVFTTSQKYCGNGAL